MLSHPRERALELLSKVYYPDATNAELIAAAAVYATLDATNAHREENDVFYTQVAQDAKRDEFDANSAEDEERTLKFEKLFSRPSAFADDEPDDYLKKSGEAFIDYLSRLFPDKK